MWNEQRIKQCDNCKNGEEIHEQGEYHEICKAGNCIYCFQCEQIDCDYYVEKNKK